MKIFVIMEEGKYFKKCIETDSQRNSNCFRNRISNLCLNVLSFYFFLGNQNNQNRYIEEYLFYTTECVPFLPFPSMRADWSRGNVFCWY